MIYHEFKDTKISALGYGLMRLPVLDEDNAKIDVKETEKLLAYAMEQGINYYDTAYGYHRGNSEPVIGEILSVYPRDSFHLASKFPGYAQENHAKCREIFQSQLDRCHTEYFDFYLLHTVSDNNIDWYLDRSYGLIDYLASEKAAGRIRHLGFSTHASLENTRRLFEAYHEHLEFCQIQLNWLDWTYQEARKTLALAQEYGVPAWVMEPLRGGKLAKLEPEYEAQLKALRPDEPISAWSFRFLQSLPEVKLVLSGMSNMDVLKQNIQTFSSFKPLNEQEKAVLFSIAEDMIAKVSAPCTNCKYCLPECPKRLDIPAILEVYNQLAMEPGKWGKPQAFADWEDHKLPAACIACHRCERQCPQGIKIAEIMAKFASKMEV